MKNLTLALIIATAFAACGGKQNESAAIPVVIVDTAAIQRNAVIAEQARLKAEQDSILIAKNAIAQERANNAVVKRRTTTRRSSNVGTSETPSSSSSTTVTETPNRKQGWSKAATGAAIGAGAGGIAGSVIDHGKGRGTIIGAAVGAGAGYIIGRKKDVQSGRVVKRSTTTTTTTTP